MAERLTPDEIEAALALVLLRYQDPVFVFPKDEDEDEEDEEDEEEEEFVSEDELEVKMNEKVGGKKNKPVKVDDSEETLQNMLEWKANTPEKPPRSIFLRDPDVVGDCSKPFRKQLMDSDVKDSQSRLLLGKESVKRMMADVLRETEELGIDGRNVSVYGPDGEIHEILFKMWGNRKDTPVLMSSGWMKFVKTYKLKMHRDFLTIWMFRHKKTRQICFAINRHRYDSVGDNTGKLSKRISEAVFSHP